MKSMSSSYENCQDDMIIVEVIVFGETWHFLRILLLYCCQSGNGWIQILDGTKWQRQLLTRSTIKVSCPRSILFRSLCVASCCRRGFFSSTFRKKRQIVSLLSTFWTEHWYYCSWRFHSMLVMSNKILLPIFPSSTTHLLSWGSRARWTEARHNLKSKTNPCVSYITITV